MARRVSSTGALIQALVEGSASGDDQEEQGMEARVFHDEAEALEQARVIPLDPRDAAADDVVAVLIRQHVRMEELIAEVRAESGLSKVSPFTELRRLIVVHEAAEEVIVRPFTTPLAGSSVTGARNDEEKNLIKVLQSIEDLDVRSAHFESGLDELERLLREHARNEEWQEFPFLLAKLPESRRRRLGKAVLLEEKVAPTHPHPKITGSLAAQMAVGPLAAVVDRLRDAVKGIGSHD